MTCSVCNEPAYEQNYGSDQGDRRKIAYSETNSKFQYSQRIKNKEAGMNKDRVEGKIKDVGGRVERQVGEWTGDTEKQAHGAVKQAEGKVQNAWGKVKDAGKKATDKSTDRTDADEPEVEEETEIRTTRRKVS
jgi:uncharacterized protein YjbJ (UPF0337 family)